MPHSTASFRYLAQWSAGNFHSDMEQRMKNENSLALIQFRRMLDLLFRNAMPPHVITEQTNAFLLWRGYPEFCNRIIGFYPDGTIQLRETIPARMLIPASPPARFNHDIMLSLVPLLPFPTLGRLAKTCKWMNAHISQEQVDRALARCRELFDTAVDIITINTTAVQPSRTMIRMFTTNEEAVEVGFMHPNRQIVRLRIVKQGRIYLGVPTPSDQYSKGFADLFDHVENCIIERESGIASSGKKKEGEKPLVWLDYRNSHNHDSGDVIFVRFFTDFKTHLVSNEVRMHFTELFV